MLIANLAVFSSKQLGNLTYKPNWNTWIFPLSFQ